MTIPPDMSWPRLTRLIRINATRLPPSIDAVMYGHNIRNRLYQALDRQARCTYSDVLLTASGESPLRPEVGKRRRGNAQAPTYRRFACLPDLVASWPVAAR